MRLDLAQFGFGITGHVPLDIVRELAPMVEQAGFRTLWINHTKEGNALASIEMAASVTDRLRLATGVTSLDNVMPVNELVRQVRERDLPLNRLVLGIGASQPPSPLRTIHQAVGFMREELPGVPIYVGALGPRMRALGARETDGLVLTWLTPEGARIAMQERIADAPGSPANVSLYTRCAVGEKGRITLAEEARRYETFPGYKANFARLGFSALDASIAADSPGQLVEQLYEYQGIVNETVLRAITGEETIGAYGSLVEAATY